VSTFGEMMRRARADAEQGEWNPGPGTHEAIVVEGTAYESKAGEPWAKTTLRYVKAGHPDEGREWAHLMGFRSPQQAAMSAGQLALYGIPGEVLDDLDEVDDLDAHMQELEGLHVTVTCKLRTADDPSSGVWTNIIGSRTGKSDVPADQASFALGDDRKGPPAPKSAIAGEVDDDPIPYRHREATWDDRYRPNR
jgi:hypothetical protein